MSLFTPLEFASRLASLRGLLRQKEIDLAILNVNADLYYYTGSVEPLYLLVPVEGSPLLLARKGFERIRDEVPQIALEPFSGSKDLERIIAGRRLLDVKKVGLTLEITSYATVSRWLKLFEGATPIDLSNDLRLLRMVKSPAEIAIMAKAGAIMAKLPDIVKEGFNPGMTELELSAIVENYFRLNHHGIIVRSRREGMEIAYGVCAAGVNSLVGAKFDGICTGKGVSRAMPYGACDEAIPEGVPIIMDYGFALDGYHMDQTRMFCYGEPPSPVRDAYAVMLEVEQLIIAHLHPGTLWSVIYEESVKKAAQFGYEREFMGLNPEKVKFVGHGIGVELDEPPILAPKNDFPLEAGMVVAIEPKVSLEGVGVVGIEDTYVVSGEGEPKLLTTAPRDFVIL
jgi:Xaa-Pro dipeptidase